MAITTFKAGARGQLIATGDQASLVNAVEAGNQLLTGPGKVAQIIVTAVGVGWTVDIYDSVGTNTGPVWRYVTADGKNVIPVQRPIQNGIYVVSAGAPGELTIVWTKG